MKKSKGKKSAWFAQILKSIYRYLLFEINAAWPYVMYRATPEKITNTQKIYFRLVYMILIFYYQ